LQLLILGAVEKIEIRNTCLDARAHAIGPLYGTDAGGLPLPNRKDDFVRLALAIVRFPGPYEYGLSSTA
jgi:hypothetical protein